MCVRWDCDNIAIFYYFFHTQNRIAQQETHLQLRLRMNVLCLCYCGTSALLLFGHKESLLNNLFHIFFGSTTNYNRQCFQLLANWYDTVQITTIHFRGMCTPAGQWIYFIQQIRNTTRDSPSMLHTLVCVCVVCEWAVVNACVTKATSLFFFCFNFIRFWIVVVASVIYIYIYCWM